MCVCFRNKVLLITLKGARCGWGVGGGDWMGEQLGHTTNAEMLMGGKKQ